MKKIVAALGTLLIVAGVKAQTTPVKKPTTPQEKSDNVVAPTNTSVKLVKNHTVKGTTTIKLTTEEGSAVPTQKGAQKVEPIVIKKAGR